MIIMGNKIMRHISVYYYPDENVFKDCNGKVIFNMFKLVSPNKIFLFKFHKENCEVINYEYGIIVELLYPI